ncbi:hypothetical protein [Deinococcus cellulosilyticus]|nr:hypothetical protein [Deinococcus cellulosilyticus]
MTFEPIPRLTPKTRGRPLKPRHRAQRLAAKALEASRPMRRWKRKGFVRF